MMKMPRLLMTASASGVVGPLAPSAMILTFVADLLDGLGVDLVLQGAGQEDVDVLLDPGVAGQALVAEGLGLGLVDAAEAVGDGQELLEVDAALLAVGVGGLVVLVPAGHGDDLAAELGEELDGVLGDVAEALDGGGRSARS